MQDQILKLGELIKNSQRILLINHIRMDGDAWGSLGGLALILQNMGKDIKAINDCPVPPSLQFLGSNELIEPDLDVTAYNPDIIISLDASDTGRLGKTYIKWEKIFQEKTLVVIDHHISNPAFGDINIIDTEASSVCELLVHILQELTFEKYITSEAATFLYTGLQTDSNMYFNTNTRSSTLRAGATLIDLGANFRKPIMELYKKRTANQLTVWKYAFENVEYLFDKQVCACIFTREGLRKLNINKDELGGYFKGLISELLINIEGIQIAYLLYPLDEHESKVSMRSQEGYNVAQICEFFGGGGHLQASGFQSTSSTEDTIKQLHVQIKKILS